VVNRFSLLRYVGHADHHTRTPDDIAVPVVDGVPLFERLKDRYPGLAVSLVAPPSRQWLGTPVYAERGSRYPKPSAVVVPRAVILNGSCKIAECCGVAARIDLFPTTVVWSDFFARGHPPIPAGLRFEFDRKDYEGAIGAIMGVPPIPWGPDPT
jgi:hypothetical protein